MDWKDYLMNDIWPLLNDEQKERLADIAETLAEYAPPKVDTNNDTD